MKQLVYAMRDRNTQLVKIGISVAPNARATEVAKRFSADVELLGVLEVENPQKVEQFMHNTLASHRVVGEWFQPDAVTLDYVLAFFVKTQNYQGRKMKKASRPLVPIEDVNVKRDTKDANGGAEQKPPSPNLHKLDGTKEDLAELIRATMAKRRVTAVKLAEATGMTPEYISQIKNGHRNLSFEATTRLLEALNLELTAEERGGK